MANTILNSTIILRKFQEIFHSKIKFTGLVDRQYDEQFKGSGTAGKPGTTLSVRKPAQFTIRSGRVADVQNIVAEKVDITCTVQEGVDVSMTSEELTMNIDDLSKLVLEPAAARLATRIDTVGLELYKKVANSVGDFTVDAADDLLAAGEMLNLNLAPEESRKFIINPYTNRKLVNALYDKYNPSQAISQQNKTGMIAQGYGFDFYLSQNVATHTCGTRVATANQYTYSSLSGATLTIGTAAVTWKAGDTITIDGIYDVNPETKVSTGKLKQFAILADADTTASGALTITPTPVLYSSDPARANCTGTAGTYVQVTGTASYNYGMNLAFVPQAFTLVTADLVLPPSVDAKREVYDGISMRFIQDYDVINDVTVGRFDVFYGWTALRPEWAVRMPATVA